MLLAGGKSDRYFCTFCISTNLRRHDDLVVFVFQDPKNPKSAMFGTDVVTVSFPPTFFGVCEPALLWLWIELWKRLSTLSSFVNILLKYEHLITLQVILTISTNLFLGIPRFLPKRSWNQWWTKWRTFLVASRIRLAACPVYRLPRKTKQQMLLSQKTRNEHNFNSSWFFSKSCLVSSIKVRKTRTHHCRSRCEHLYLNLES